VIRAVEDMLREWDRLDAQNAQRKAAPQGNGRRTDDAK
jgi:hypothetical protein